MATIFLCVAGTFTQVFCMDEFLSNRQYSEIFTGHIVSLRECLDVNRPINRDGETLLHTYLKSYYAPLDKDESDKPLKRIQCLLKHNASLEAKDRNGSTPFDVALYNGDLPLLSFLSVFGYQFSPASLDPEENPLELLQNNAQKYKEFIRKGDTQATNTLANLFVFIQNNENNQLRDQKKIPSSSSGIMINSQGCSFKHTTFADLAHWVGREAIDFVMQDLNKICADAFDIAQEGDAAFYDEIQSIYPFVGIYRERNVLELLKDGARLFKELVRQGKARYAQNILGEFFNELEERKELPKTALRYCFEEFESFGALKQMVGKETIRYVRENLSTIEDKLLAIAQTRDFFNFRLKCLKYPFAARFQILKLACCFDSHNQIMEVDDILGVRGNSFPTLFYLKDRILRKYFEAFFYSRLEQKIEKREDKLLREFDEEKTCRMSEIE